MLGYDQFQPMFVVKSQYSSMNLISKNIKSKGACDVYSQENNFSRDMILNCFVCNAQCMILKGQLVDFNSLFH